APHGATQPYRVVLQAGAAARSSRRRPSPLPARPPCPGSPNGPAAVQGSVPVGGRPTGGLTDFGGPHVDRSQSLGVLLHFKLDPLALGERLQATGLQGADMDEHILALLGGDEAIAPVGVEPLHGPNHHRKPPWLSRTGRHLGPYPILG